MKSSLKSSVIILAILISIVSLGIGTSTAAGENSNNPSVIKIGPTTRGDSLSFEQLQKIEIMVMDSPPWPPKGIQRFSVTSIPQSAAMLSVPTSTWTYGCSATSAGMIFGYYDRTGYSNMYTGPTNDGIAPLTDLGQGIGTPIAGSCSIIATQNGFDGRTTRGHVDDYWTGYLNPGPDPWEGYWTEHTWGGCTADYMGTNQWKWDFEPWPNGNGSRDNDVDGATSLWANNSAAKLYDFVPPLSCGLPQTELCHGMRMFAESRGYTVQENYTQRIAPATSGGFSLADYRTEINNGHPVMIQLEGHSMVGVGYESASSQTIYVNDTWDNTVHSMTWGGIYSGMQHWGVTVIHLNPVNPVPPVAQDGSASTQINTPVTITLVAIDDGLPNPPGALTYIITSLPSNSQLSDPGNGIISSVPYSLVSFGNQVIYTPDVSFTGSDSFQFKANDGGTPPNGGDSNQANVFIEIGLIPIYVNVNATGADNGSSWADAYTGLQSALSAAVGGDEIWVAAGTYKPTTNADRTISFVMKTGVAIYGGFNGTETQRDLRNWITNQTILSGDIGTQGNNSDNSYHVVVGATDTTLDGFTITGGNANLQQGMYTSGGGMFNDSSNPTVINCTFSGNSANYGGGMYNWSGSPTVINCVFNGNSAPAGEYPGCGGGMWNGGDNSPTVTNCTFSGNSGSYGGAMFNYSGGNPIITNCTFTGNSADYGGALDNGSSSPTLINCILWANTAPNGSQIFNFESATITVSFSDVQGGQPGTGNINENPRFIGAGDFRLQVGSPCIDAGNNSAMPAGVTTDLAGNPRFIDDPYTVDTGAGTPPIVDMGAFEYEYIPLPQYSLTASAGPNGTISPSGIFTVNQGSNVLFTTTANPGYTVDTWYLDGNSVQQGNTTYTLYNVQADHNVLVTFVEIPPAIYVDANSPNDPGTGTRNDPFRRLQDGIDAQAQAGEVWVVAGTYKPGADRTISFVMKEGVAVYGGFIGTETNRDQRDWVANQTILSGDIGIQGDNSDNSYRVVIGANNATLDGFTIADAHNEDDYGGGMYNEEINPTVTNCTFSGNSAFAGGGMFNESSSPTVVNCTFIGNSAEYGGGMCAEDSSLTLVNCTFSGNFATSEGGGISNYGGGLTVTNCILWGNTSPSGEFGGDGPPTVNYSDIQGGWEGSNIDTDPLFAGSGDLRLQAGSPCIDTGDNSAVPTGVTTDLAGNPRIQDADCDGQTIVDMGAFEFYLVGDLSKNCLVDLSDIDLFTDNWLETGCAAINNWCDGADIDKNGNIDLSDFADIAEHWLECTSPECG